MVEHGAYLLMLHAYYGTERPLPTGTDLYRLVRATTKAEKAAVDSVVKQFWKKTDAGLVNGRAFIELTHAVKAIETSRENGGKGGRPKKNPSGYPNKTHQVS